MNPPLLAALAYVRRGWSVIPLWPRQKRPLVPWAAYQRARADETEVREWYDRWPDANDLLLCWNATRCRPPLGEDEVGRTVGSIARIHAEESEGPDASATA